MANQMIALGVKGPQLPDVGAISARFANVMANTAVAREKQNAVQRANEFRRLAESGIDTTTPEGFNQLSGLDPEGAATLRKSALEAKAKQAEMAINFLGVSREELSRANTPEEAVVIGAQLKQAFPEFATNVDETLKTMPVDPAKFPSWRENTNFSALKSADRMKYFRDQVTTELATGVGGQPLVVTRGGFKAPTIMEPQSLIPAPQTPVKKEVELGEPFNIGGVGGPYTNDTADILDGIVSAQNDRDYQDALALVERANPDMVAALRRTMPRFDPTRIKGIRAEFSRAFGGQAGAPLVAGDRGGVGGPDEGYVEAPTPFRLKDPMQAPMPGSAIVPIQRVREEAAAQRRTPGETYQEQRSQEQAKSDVAFLDAYESSKSDAQNILSVIDQMIGDLNVKDGKIVQGKRPPHPGFEGVIGAGIPGIRFIPGTQAADFDAFMEQVQGGAFLKAYNALRGTGQITEKEGEKATTALSRMKRSQSEAGFIKAAREFEGVVRSAVQRADARAARLRGGTSTPTRTPVNKSAGGKNRPPLSSFEGR